MIAAVSDTHTAFGISVKDGLSVAAGDFALIDRAAAAGSHIVVSSISLAEIVYLIEKTVCRQTPDADLKAALVDPDHVFKEGPLTGN